jgi:hypothetical protein
MGVPDWETVVNMLGQLASGNTPWDVADKDTGTAQGLQNTAENQWKNDRAAKSTEWQQLSGQYSDAAPRVAPVEPFATWSHRQIWDALHGDGKNGEVNAGDIAITADGWRKLVQDGNDAIDAFHKGIESDIQNLWVGKASNAAMDATRTYVTQALKLPVAFQEVANGISTLQGYLDQAKMSVEPPQELSSIDQILGHVPGNGVLKLHKYRADEAHARAQHIMTTFYQPGAQEVDARTPVLPTPVNPTQNPGPGPNIPGPGPGTPGNTNPGPGNTHPGGPGNTNPGSPGPGPHPGDPNNPNGQNPNGTQPSNTSPGNGNPAGTNPAGLTPTMPASLTPGTPTTATPTMPSGITPDFPGDPGGLTPGGIPAGTTTPGGPGRSIPGDATKPGTMKPGAPGPGKGPSGMPGMPGMPHGRGKDEEDEHTVKPKDYLVWERETELFGRLPPSLPPGGVIGG